MSVVVYAKVAALFELTVSRSRGTFEAWNPSLMVCFLNRRDRFAFSLWDRD